MADFLQDGSITTLHNLADRKVEDIEEELRGFRGDRPMALILPSLYSELQGEALPNILEELSQASYLDDIVVGLDRATEDEYRHALEFFGRLPQRTRVLWNDGPRLRRVHDRLAEMNLAPKELGKGCNVWYCMGFVLAATNAEAIGLHDCDIVTYQRDLPARLIYPVANPKFRYQFAKGYYARVSGGKLNGRVCRLMVGPLLAALTKICGPSDYLNYMGSFRYALAGEFSFRRDVLNDLRIPSDWGLEVGVLSEMHRNYSRNQLCQVDIARAYDHKHQDLSEDDVRFGLSRMSIDIAKALFRKLATQGVTFHSGTFRALKATYYRAALDFVDAYHNDAVINDLDFDVHAEERAVELFAENIMRAGEIYLDRPMDTPFIPSWNRVRSAYSNVFEDIAEAVEEDHRQFRPKGGDSPA